jgi:hypothetical protein
MATSIHYRVNGGRKGNNVPINEWYTVYDLKGSYNLIVGNNWMTANPHVIDHGNNTLYLLGEGWSSFGARQPNRATATSIVGLRSHQGAFEETQVYYTSVAEDAGLTLMTGEAVHR